MQSSEHLAMSISSLVINIESPPRTPIELKIPPGYTPEARGRRTSIRPQPIEISSTPSVIIPTGPTRGVKQRKVCGLHVTTATILVCVLTIIIQVVPFMMIGGTFVTNGKQGSNTKPLSDDPKAYTALMIAGILLLLEAGGLLVVDVMLLLGVMMDRYNRVIPFVIMQVITIFTGLLIAILARVYNIKTVVEVIIYHGFAAIFNVFALYTVSLCYLEMKEQERMYKYFANRMAELANRARNTPRNTGRFTSSPVSPDLSSPNDIVSSTYISPINKDELARSMPKRLPESPKTPSEKLTYRDTLAVSIPRHHSKQNEDIHANERSASVPLPSQSYWKTKSSKEKTKVAKSMEEIDHDRSKISRQKSHLSTGSVSSKSSVSTVVSSQTSSESIAPVTKSILKPSKRASGGAQNWATYNMMDIFRPQQTSSSKMKSTRDVPSLQSQWQTIQESLASQNDIESPARIASSPNAPPGNKASYPGFTPTKIPPGNKASYTGSVANIPPGNKATSFTTATSSFSSSTYSSSGNTFDLHPSSGHTIHSLHGRALHPASGHLFNQLPRTPGRDGSRRITHQRERRFTANHAPIAEESPLPSDSNKEKKSSSKKKVSKNPKKK